MDNSTFKCLMGLRMKIQAKFIFSTAIFAVLFCSLCAISFGENVEPIHITGKVMNQDGVLQKYTPIKLTIHQPDGEETVFYYNTNSVGVYSIPFYTSKDSATRISVTSEHGGYNEKIYKYPENDDLNLVILKHPCTIPGSIIRGKVKNAEGSPIEGIYLYVDVDIPIESSQAGESSDKILTETVTAGSSYTDKDGNYILVPSFWTIDESGADARIVIADANYNTLLSEKLRIRCGSGVYKDIVIEEKNTTKKDMSNGEKSNVSEGNISSNSNTGNSSDNNNNNSFLNNPLLISLIVIIGVIILSMILLKYGKRNI